VRPQRLSTQTGGGWSSKYKHYAWQIRTGQSWTTTPR